MRQDNHTLAKPHTHPVFCDNLAKELPAMVTTP